MYIASSIHRDELFNIAGRWLRGQLEPNDALRLTEILICDGFVIGETLEVVTRLLLEEIYDEPFRRSRITSKGELRDALCGGSRPRTPRMEELYLHYRSNPDFFYRDAPINGVVYRDADENILGLYRVKRFRRIAEKANRYVANWIYDMVRSKAEEMAEDRARKSGVPLEMLYTPEAEMTAEFIRAEEAIARSISSGEIELDKNAMSIRDVGGVKIIADAENLEKLEQSLPIYPMIRVVGRRTYNGNYRAVRLLVEVLWDAEQVCRRFIDGEGWRRYLDRGVSEEKLKKGLEPLLAGAQPTLLLELMFSVFDDFVESEIGASIHEERIVAQRDNKAYKGYIPLNVELLIQYLFEVGFCPKVHIGPLPIKLWGRYLPDTVISCIRSLYGLPRRELY
jgi:hypothetical protein